MQTDNIPIESTNGIINFVPWILFDEKLLYITRILLYWSANYISYNQLINARLDASIIYN